MLLKFIVFVAVLCFGLGGKLMAIDYEILKGERLLSAIDDLAKLRIEVFKEYPYLYEGDMSYERKYLKTYASEPDSVLIVAKDQDKFIGAITGIPLKKSFQELIDCYEKQNASLDEVYYLGEIVLQKEYRSQGIGVKLYEEFEWHVRFLPGFEKIAFCEVKREESHLQKPPEYKNLDEFWEKRGYEKLPNRVAYFSWKEIGSEEETKHPMVFFEKKI